MNVKTKNLSTVNLYIKVELFIKIAVIILYFMLSLFIGRFIEVVHRLY